MWQSSNWPRESCFMVLFSILANFKDIDQLCSRLTPCLYLCPHPILPPHITPYTKQSFYLLFIFLLLFIFFCQILQTNPCSFHFSRKKKKEREETFFYKPQTRQILIFFFLTSTHPILWSEHLCKLFHRGFQKMLPPGFALKSAGILADGRNHIHTHWLKRRRGREEYRQDSHICHSSTSHSIIEMT